MTVAARLAGFVAALAAIFGVAAAVGAAVGPTNRAQRAGEAAGQDAMGMGGRAAGEAAHGAERPGAHGSPAHDALPQGLAVAAAGLRLVPASTTAPPARTRAYRFRIADAAGRTVRDFEVEHARRLHLVAVRRDLTGFVHVHPRQRDDGSWSVPLRLRAPGSYRVFADFTARGRERATLGTDLFVPGAARAVALPAPTAHATTDGYEVALRSERERGGDRALAFTVTRGGERVAVQPYLGADGHLVVLRQGDLAYLHAHPGTPDGAGGDGPRPIRFMVDYPSAGRYRLVLQFRHGGRVHTAAFTQEVR